VWSLIAFLFLLIPVPLSGSQTVQPDVQGYEAGRLSTPSLGITELIESFQRNYPMYRLSTPSLGITRDDIEGLYRRGLEDPEHLSTPSLGITEPDPGFSGSPRLSAAAPLRTNEF
jgi:hypothetical protein